MFNAREEDESAICSHLVRGTLIETRETNIDPCILSEFSAESELEPVSFSLSLLHITKLLLQPLK